MLLALTCLGQPSSLTVNPAGQVINPNSTITFPGNLHGSSVKSGTLPFSAIDPTTISSSGPIQLMVPPNSSSSNFSIVVGNGGSIGAMTVYDYAPSNEIWVVITNAGASGTYNFHVTNGSVTIGP